MDYWDTFNVFTQKGSKNVSLINGNTQHSHAFTMENNREKLSFVTVNNE